MLEPQSTAIPNEQSVANRIKGARGVASRTAFQKFCMSLERVRGVMIRQHVEIAKFGDSGKIDCRRQRNTHLLLQKLAINQLRSSASEEIKPREHQHAQSHFDFLTIRTLHVAV